MDEGSSKKRKVDSLGRVRPAKYSKQSKRAIRKEAWETDSVQSSSPSQGVVHPIQKPADHCHLGTLPECEPECEPVQHEAFGISENGEDTESSSCAREGKTFNDLLRQYIEENPDFNPPEFDNPPTSDDENEDSSDHQTDPETHTEGASEPIYKGHWMSTQLSALLIMLFAVSYSITGQQFADLLILIQFHLLSVPTALESVFKLKKFFAGMQSPVVRFFYCTFCHAPVNSNQEVCSNPHCLKDLSTSTSKSYFLTIPLVHQIRTLFSSDTFVHAIGHRFRRKKKSATSIEDVYDGELYQKLCVNNGPLSHQHNLSFTMNTDGVPLFKSSKMSMWPVYLAINELPYKLRKQKNNMLFYGIWFGETKPAMATFCEPLHEVLRTFESEGVEVDINGQTVTCRCFLLCFTADLPAKATMLNMLQFNGASSCIRCLQRGENFRTSGGGNVHTFPYSMNNPTGPQRTHEVMAFGDLVSSWDLVYLILLGQQVSTTCTVFTWVLLNF